MRPGLYLEHLTGALRDDTTAARIGTGRSRRFRMVSMAWTQFAMIAAVGYVFFWILFYRD